MLLEYKAHDQNKVKGCKIKKKEYGDEKSAHCDIYQ